MIDWPTIMCASLHESLRNAALVFANEQPRLIRVKKWLITQFMINAKVRRKRNWCVENVPDTCSGTRLYLLYAKAFNLCSLNFYRIFLNRILSKFSNV